MRNLTWKVAFKRNCDGNISCLIKIKYKMTICNVIVPDIDTIKDRDDLTEQIYTVLKTAFKKKESKKIANQVIEELSGI